jgi:predicted DNA-binding protein YlxM (UPF0122 family)
MWLKPNFTKEYLLEQYVNKRRTMLDIAKEVGVNSKTVKCNLILNGIEIRKSPSNVLTKDILIREYVDNERSTRSIAEEFGTSHQSVRAALKKWNIPTRTCSRKDRPDLISRKHKKIISIGDRFGKLTVAQRLDEVIEKWNCVCDCGSSIIVSSRNLSRNRVKSCGCLKGKIRSGYEGMSGKVVSRYANGARRRDIEFNITAKDMWELFVSQQSKCAISGVAINLEDKTASLDRIDSGKGYIVGNIQWVHKTMNLMKFTMSNSELIEWCLTVTEYNRKT